MAGKETKCDAAIAAEVVKRLHSGEEITDEDLNTTINYLAALTGEFLGPLRYRYFLMLSDMQSALEQLEGFRQARLRNGQKSRK